MVLSENPVEQTDFLPDRRAGRLGARCRVCRIEWLRTPLPLGVEVLDAAGAIPLMW